MVEAVWLGVLLGLVFCVLGLAVAMGMALWDTIQERKWRRR